jgi:HD-like signal output (HDOD) protein
MTMEELLHNPKALPTAPKVVDELINSFDNPKVSVEEIVRTLSTDPVLSAKLLRLANSAYYHVSRSIGTVDDAVRMLGFVTVRTLVISSGLVSGFKTAPGLDLKRFWRYSLHTAVGARWIAGRCRESTELAFMIGLMHAIGQVVIHAGMPGQAQELDKIASPYHPSRAYEEMTAWGYDFSEVGAELARRWKFPDAFMHTIHNFPEPLHQNPPIRLAAVIHLAVWRAQLEENKASAADAAASLPLDVAACIGLGPEVLLDEMPPLADLSAGLEELIIH